MSPEGERTKSITGMQYGAIQPQGLPVACADTNLAYHFRFRGRAGGFHRVRFRFDNHLMPAFQNPHRKDKILDDRRGGQSLVQFRPHGKDAAITADEKAKTALVALDPVLIFPVKPLPGYASL